MRFITKDRSFYKQLLTIAIPIAMQNLINFAVAMADTVMLGVLGEPQLAAINLANKFSTIFTLFTFGLGSGANVLVAQYWGKGDKQSIKRTMTYMYRALIVGGLFFSLIAIFLPSQAMSIFSKDLEVRVLGAEYLSLIGFSYILAGFVSVTTILLRSVGSVRVSVMIYLSSLITNIILNWVFIFGNLGAPALGMRGAAIGTIGARIVEVIILILYMVNKEHKIMYKVKDFFTKGTKGDFIGFAQISTPVVINEIIWGMGSTVISVIIGHMGRAFTAADSVSTVLNQLVTIFIWGVGHAAAAIIGNTVGAGKNEKAKEYASTLTLLSVALGIASSLVVLLLRNPMIGMFNISDEAKGYAYQLISVYAVVVIFQSISAVCLIGILRGGGNPKFVLVMDVVFMWIICIPFGYLAGLKWILPVYVVYAILRSDEFFKAISAIIKIARGNWIHSVILPSESDIAAEN